MKHRKIWKIGKKAEVQKHVFWQALLIAIFIFVSGMLLGYLLELNRTSKIISFYQEAEVSLLDVNLQEQILDLNTFDCEQAIEEMIKFADKTYNEADILEKYSQSSKLTKGIVFQYKKYALLRTILWANSMKIKEKCANAPHTVIYFFEFDSDDSNMLAEQRTFSNYLGEIKKEYSSEIILIPIAGNFELNSINLLMNTYGITRLPSVLIDEKYKVEEINQLENIRNYLK